MDKEIEEWLKLNQEWVLYKCLYFTKDMNDAEELRGDVFEHIWRYKDNFNAEPTDANFKNYFFFIIKYRYFQSYEKKYKKAIYEFEYYKDHTYIDDNLIINKLDLDSLLIYFRNKVKKELGDSCLKIFDYLKEDVSVKDMVKKININDKSIYFHIGNIRKCLQDLPFDKKNKSGFKNKQLNLILN